MAPLRSPSITSLSIAAFSASSDRVCACGTMTATIKQIAAIKVTFTTWLNWILISIAPESTPYARHVGPTSDDRGDYVESACVCCRERDGEWRVSADQGPPRGRGIPAGGVAPP